MKYQSSLRELKNRKIRKFVLIGDEPYLKDYFIRTAKSLFSDHEILDFYPEQIEDISVFRTSGLINKRMFILRNAEKILSESILNVLLYSEDFVIVILSDSADLKSPVITKLLATIEPVECNKMRSYGDDYLVWIASETVAAGFRMEGDSDKVMYERTGPNMFIIANELKKLYLYKNGERIISKDDVLQVVSQTSESNAFDILDKLLRKDVKGALIAFESYSKKCDNYMELIGSFGHYFEKLYRIFLYREQGFSPDNIAEILAIPKYILKNKYLPRVISYGKAAFIMWLEWVQKLDDAIRSYHGNKKVLVERFILRFAL